MSILKDSRTVVVFSAVQCVEYPRILAFLRVLADEGWQVVTVMPGSLNDPSLVGLVTQYPVPSTTASFWYFAGCMNIFRAAFQRLRRIFLVARVLYRVRPTLGICAEPDAWLLAVLMKKWFGMRVIADLREVYEDRAQAFPGWMQSYARRVLRWLMRRLSESTDTVIHVSDERAKLYDYLKAPSIVVAPYPRLAEKRFDVVEDVDPARKDTIRIIHAGVLRPTYASDHLVEAVDKASTCCHNLRFVVLGGIAGDLKCGHILSRLRERGVLEMREQLPHTEALAEMHRCDIGVSLVLPIDQGHRYAQPQKIYEYMAAGLPVIGADVPTIRRVLLGNNCGVVVNPFSSDEIASSLLKLACDAEEREILGQNGRRAFENKFNWESQVLTLQQLLRSVSPTVTW